MNPLISVIVPVFQVEDFLDQCLESLVNQRQANIEILLIDDGSSDNSPAICDNWGKRDSRVRVLHQTNVGLSRTRQVGVQCARGEYILFVDSDDWVEQDICYRLTQYFNKYNCDAIFFNFDQGCDISHLKLSDRRILKNSLKTSKEAVIDFLENRIQTHSWQICAKKELYNNIQFPSDRLLEDFATVYQVFDKARNGIFFTTEIYYHYRIRTGSLMHNRRDRKLSDNLIESHLKNLQEVLEYAKNNELESHFYSSYLNNLLWLYGRASSSSSQERVRSIIEYFLSTHNLNLFQIGYKYLFYKLGILRLMYTLQSLMSRDNL